MNQQVAEPMEECERCLRNQRRRWRHQYFNTVRQTKPTREFTHEEKRAPLWMADVINTGQKPNHKRAE
jgi:ABC-type uncharacterized transport system YnjBCD ATPase subunit